MMAIQGRMEMERVEVTQKGRGLEKEESSKKGSKKVIQREKGKLVQVERLEKGWVKLIQKGKGMEKV